MEAPSGEGESLGYATDALVGDGVVELPVEVAKLALRELPALAVTMLPTSLPTEHEEKPALRRRWTVCILLSWSAGL